MKTKETEKAVERLLQNDPKRLAYMVTWRDRYIAQLQETVAGHEEAERLLGALVSAMVIASCGAEAERIKLGTKMEESEGKRRLCVPRKAISELLHGYRVAAQVEGEKLYFSLLPLDGEHENEHA